MSAFNASFGERLGRLEPAVQQLQSEMLDTRRRLFRFEALEVLRERGRTPSLPVQFRSQYGEDILLWALFDEQPDGFFIEAGAYDGVEFSPSYLFESIGWKGLLVEPLPDRHEACVKNRPGSRVVHAALSRAGSTGTTTFESVEGEGAAGMFSFLHATPHHLETVRATNWKRRQVTVPLTSLNALLADHNGPIDFAIIDVEGGELELLHGFDLARYRPRVMLIEDNTRGKNSGVPAYMSSFPYTELGWIGVNRIYIRADETALIDRLQSG